MLKSRMHSLSLTLYNLDNIYFILYKIYYSILPNVPIILIGNPKYDINIT